MEKHFEVVVEITKTFSKTLIVKGNYENADDQNIEAEILDREKFFLSSELTPISSETKVIKVTEFPANFSEYHMKLINTGVPVRFLEELSADAAQSIWEHLINAKSI